MPPGPDRLARAASTTSVSSERPPSGEASAEFYFGLVGKDQGPWNATFVKGVGYKKFEAERDREVKSVGELMENAGFKMP